MQETTLPFQSLTEALGKSEHAKDLVEESAEELASINTTLKEELADGKPQPGVESALEKSEAVEDKVQEASDELAVVNQALEGEVREREILEHQLNSVTQQKDAAEHAAFHDPLTGLPNRVMFNDRLEHGLAQAKRHGWTLAVMFVDLDKFKSINDLYGHDVGDNVLQTIAARLKENTRDDDTISRHGGDEFLYLLMEALDERDITSIAEKLVNAIQVPCDVRVHDSIVTPTIKASIGIAIFPKDGVTTDALVKSADRAMYRAKQNKSGYSFVQ
jgi:diguanylate cyclase (GGDEF)-like protein